MAINKKTEKKGVFLKVNGRQLSQQTPVKCSAAAGA